MGFVYKMKKWALAIIIMFFLVQIVVVAATECCEINKNCTIEGVIHYDLIYFIFVSRSSFPWV